MNNKRQTIDAAIFFPTISILVLVCALIVVFPENASGAVDKSLRFITYNLDWVYLISVFMTMLFLIWLAFSKYGAIRFGDKSKKFSTASWASMLFCASVGSSILYWGMIEWAYYYSTPPFGIEPYSESAAEWAATYGLFHWGISAWSTYCLAGVIVGYFFYCKRTKIFRMSETCLNVIGTSKKSKFAKKAIDIFVVLGLMAGVATSLGLGTPLVSEGLHRVFNIEPSFVMNVIIILIWGSLFGISVFLGLEKGIKKFSNLNIVLAAIVLTFILFNGHTTFILSTFCNSIGLMFQNFIRMSFYTDPIAKSGFPQEWTTFYWAWWVVYVPIVGLFIARISEGRSIKEVILGTVLIGSAGCWIFFAILGNFAMSLQLDGVVDVVSALNEHGAPYAIMEVLSELPYAKVVIAMYVVLAFISLATSFDSVAYMLASITTSTKNGFMEPSRGLRVFWAFAITILPIALLFLGGLKTLQMSSVVGSIPLLVIVAIMVVSFTKELKKSENNLEIEILTKKEIKRA
ncbi:MULTISPECIES: BCCT family transporter [unclassified Fusibacter]|uniref:BCCT family transporter n=1 Tax=unclassified Fusibacter TaxID=2624464 RepID=UPI0010118552|nr:MULTISPECIES: BCCT family transporter [unclassified Fusibacter]MCK8058437.1 BCCT family transporter [Fusibacter sp. A2]NPE22795.1 BCCT family transporter [Fusibacter sp. A1]RXV60351.1 BCCT family transporter [Fusibacter sp. A1]